MRFPLKMGVKIAHYLFKNKLKNKKRFAIVLMLEPTHKCNLRCEGCGRIVEYKNSAKKELSVEECIKSVKDCGAPVVTVTGGEPLLYSGLEELLNKLVKMGKCIYLCTNGLLLEEKLELLPKNYPLFFINVHIDGLEETHDKIVNREGTFAKAIKGIEKAVKNGFNVCTNTTVYRKSDVEKLKQLFEMLTKMGVKGLLAAPGYPYEVLENADFFLDKEEIYKKFRILKKEIDKFPFINTPPYFKYLCGEKELECTPWGCPTRNTQGWKGPCYLITDNHYNTYKGLMEDTDWEKFEKKQDPRCRYCMVHSGFEPTVSVGKGITLGEKIAMVYWSFF